MVVRQARDIERADAAPFKIAIIHIEFVLAAYIVVRNVIPIG
jgi:hypothetical protein